MIKERCTFCKGMLQEGKTEFIARVGPRTLAETATPDGAQDPSPPDQMGGRVLLMRRSVLLTI